MSDDLSRFPVLGPRQRGRVARHEVTLPGQALERERWTVTSVTGAEPGPAVFINAGVHGAEYPAIQTVIELSGLLDATALRGTVVLMPVVNLPGFRERSMFVCPVDGKNPNRVFPGSPDGTYSEQLAHALMTEFILQSDAHIDLHGGDMVEALIPFTICQRGASGAAQAARALAEAFGLRYLLAVDRPVQPASGTTTYAAATTAGVPSIIAEAGGVGLLRAADTALLREGVLRSLVHLGVAATGPEPAPEPIVLTRFEWLYTPMEGMFYPVVGVGDRVEAGAVVGAIGSLTGERLAQIHAPVSGTILFLTTSPAMRRTVC